MWTQTGHFSPVGLCFSSCKVRKIIEAPVLGCCEHSAGHVHNRHSVIIRLQVTPALDWKRCFCGGCSLRSRLLRCDWGVCKAEIWRKVSDHCRAPFEHELPLSLASFCLLPDPHTWEDEKVRNPAGPQVHGIMVALSFCSRLYCAPHSLEGQAVWLLELLTIDMLSWIWALPLKAMFPWAENQPLNCLKQKRGFGPPWVVPAVLWRVMATTRYRRGEPGGGWGERGSLLFPKANPDSFLLIMWLPLIF